MVRNRGDVEVIDRSVKRTAYPAANLEFAFSIETIGRATEEVQSR